MCFLSAFFLSLFSLSSPLPRGERRRKRELRGGASLADSLSRAAVSVCGPYKNWIYCYRVAFAANAIAHNCGWNGLAGGYFVFDDPNALRFPIHKN